MKRRSNHPWRKKPYKKEVLYRRAMVSDKQYNELLRQQGYCCAICGTNQQKFKQRLAVDHDHNTGKVCGLLCFNCNAMLGQAKDNQVRLINGAIYLKKYTS